MSDANDAFFSEKLSLLTLKGEISVHFLDGNVIEGEFATQDAFNIFLTIEGEPMMIPRQQVRYVKGKHGQPIEKDTSQEAFLESPPASSAELDRPVAEAYVVENLTAEAEAAPVEVMAGIVETFDDDDDDDDGTVILGPPDDLFTDDDSDDDDDDDGTVVLPAGISEIMDEDEDEDDGTVILAAPAGLEPVLDADDATVLVSEGQQQPQLSGRLLCTGGPHSGQSFNLAGDTTTIGRSGDNDIVLSGDKEISRHHSSISKRSDKYVVQDLDSLNGTFVNDERLTTPRSLENNDVVVVGISVLRFQED